ncbi:hypothetical protein [Bacillus timonensis]|uniref:hypothetical protein n=1 Tax=Bacillus timonensis TaxID=1033734 RepID=UPI00028882C4|nr:hypothetical protein [Bacillus timonensis]
MDSKLKGIGIIILILCSLYGFVPLFVDIQEIVYSIFDDGYRYEKKSDRDLDQIGNIYELGIIFGDDAAKMFEIDSYQGVNFDDMKTREDAVQIASFLYRNRVNDFICLGPQEGDCMSMPTDKELIEKYRNNEISKYNSERSTVNAFYSGYVDGFLSYYNY